MNWQKGPPPQDEEWYVVTYTRLDNKQPSPGMARWDYDHQMFLDDGGAFYTTAITHHLPTPIQTPKES